MSNRPPMISSEASIIIELGYFFAIFLLSLNIYVQTRKTHDFSFHRGIRYFQNTFLSFSLVYVFRFLILSLQILPNPIAPEFQTDLLQLVMFLVVLFSYFAIFSLLSSFSWKRYKFISDTRVAFISVAIACITFFARQPLLLLAVGIFAATSLAVRTYEAYKQTKRVFSTIFVIYLLLLVFILFDLIPAIQGIMPIEFEVAGYLGSICVFVYTNLKVRKVLATGEEEK